MHAVTLKNDIYTVLSFGVDKWMNEWMSEWVNERVSEWVYIWMNDLLLCISAVLNGVYAVFKETALYEPKKGAKNDKGEIAVAR